MAKANKAAQAAKAQAPAANPTPDPKQATWPVKGPDELTVHHIPPKLRDEVLRPLRQAASIVGAWMGEQMGSINDARNMIRQVAINLDKDGERINQKGQITNVGAALVTLGIAKEQKPGGGGP